MRGKEGDFDTFPSFLGVMPVVSFSHPVIEQNEQWGCDEYQHIERWNPDIVKIQVGCRSESLFDSVAEIKG